VRREHPRTRRKSVSNHVYRLSEIVGSSPTSIDDAIRTGLAKAAETVRNIEWFQTEEIRGQVVDGEIAHFQVLMKVGFRVE
jgi:flavin-binding protein dodecin